MADQHEREHVHGSMDIRAHEKTFAGFIRLSIWAVIVTTVILIFLGLVNA